MSVSSNLQGAETPETASSNSTSPLALPAPDVSASSQTLMMDQTIKLDELGPMVVNSDGTLSRITNWKSMTPQERERTMRVLGARNKIRIANKEADLQAAGDKSIENTSTGL